MKRFLLKIRTLFRRNTLEREMVEEMRFHLEERAEDAAADGLKPDEARYAAQRKFGNVGLIQEHARDARGFVWVEQLLQDFRYAGRQMRRDKGFAFTAIAVLALGIGAITTIFSVVHGLLLKPLPYDEPGQLVQMFEASQPGRQNAVSSGVYLDWREQAASFEEITAYSGIARNFGGDSGEPERIQGLRMTPVGLQVLRARPVIGRIFSSDEDQPGRDKVVVLTEQLWQRRFGGDPSAVGQTVRIDDDAYTVVGVLPADFLPFASQEYIIPWAFNAAARDSRDSHHLRLIGRLKPGVTLEQAAAEIETINARMRPLYPAWKQDWTATLLPMQEQLMQEIRPALLVLMGAVGLILLVACANVANLLLARASVRRREISVRAALGASRGRLIRQLLAESMLLALAGGGLGLITALWSVAGLRQLLGTMGIARAHDVVLDPRVLAVSLVVSLATGLLFGLAPALRVSRTDLNDALKDASRGSSAGGHGLRSVLVVVEVGMALVLLVGAGLLLHSFVRLTDVPAGFEPERAVTLQMTVSLQKHPDLARRVAFYQQIAERAAALPGVEAAGLNASLPLAGGAPDVFFRIAGRQNHREPGYGAYYDFCTADYFRAMGIPLLRGRFFTAGEAGSDRRVALINESFAREHFPGEDPLGRQIGDGTDMWEIIGIVGNVRLRSLARDVSPMIYRAQWSRDPWRTATLVVRARPGASVTGEDLRQLMREIDPTQPVANIRSLSDVVTASLAQQRLTMGLLGLFAVVALILAAIGLYGVIAYGVTQRTREFGIRLALGASRGDLLGLVLRHGMKLVALGLVLGLAGALSLSHLLAALLYGIKPTDPLTFVGVSGVLLLAALAALWIPARRASRIDPMIALRCE